MSFDLPPHEKTAFFSIMDEYFSQRPHLDPVQLGQELAEARGGGATSAPAAPANYGASSYGAPPPPRGAKPSPFLAAGGGVPPPTRASPVSAPPPPPARDPDSIGEAEAIYAYPKSETEDLALAKGERVTLIEKISDDWWRARSQDGQAREGIVPSSYVRVL